MDIKKMFSCREPLYSWDKSASFDPTLFSLKIPQFPDDATKIVPSKNHANWLTSGNHSDMLFHECLHWHQCVTTTFGQFLMAGQLVVGEISTELLRSLARHDAIKGFLKDTSKFPGPLIDLSRLQPQLSMGELVLSDREAEVARLAADILQSQSFFLDPQNFLKRTPKEIAEFLARGVPSIYKHFPLYNGNVPIDVSDEQNIKVEHFEKTIKSNWKKIVDGTRIVQPREILESSSLLSEICEAALADPTPNVLNERFEKILGSQSIQLSYSKALKLICNALDKPLDAVTVFENRILISAIIEASLSPSLPPRGSWTRSLEISDLLPNMRLIKILQSNIKNLHFSTPLDDFGWKDESDQLFLKICQNANLSYGNEYAIYKCLPDKKKEKLMRTIFNFVNRYNASIDKRISFHTVILILKYFTFGSKGFFKQMTKLTFLRKEFKPTDILKLQMDFGYKHSVLYIGWPTIVSQTRFIYWVYNAIDKVQYGRYVNFEEFKSVASLAYTFYPICLEDPKKMATGVLPYTLQLSCLSMLILKSYCTEILFQGPPYLFQTRLMKHMEAKGETIRKNITKTLKV